MAAEEDNFYIPPERIAELQAISDGAPYPIPKDAKEAPPEIVEAIRASALAYFVNLPVSEQIEYMACLTPAEQEDILADLSPEQSDRLQIEQSSVTPSMP